MKLFIIFYLNNPIEDERPVREILLTKGKINRIEFGKNRLVGWLVGWFYGITTFVGYLPPNPFFLQIISSISNNSVYHEYTV